MTGLSKIIWSARGVGLDNLPRRVWHVLQGKLGIHRLRLPAAELSDAELRRKFIPSYEPLNAHAYWRKRAAKSLVCEDRLPGIRDALQRVAGDKCWSDHVTKQTDDLQQGHMRFFDRSCADVGWPPRFNRDAIHQVDWPTGQHWSTYGQFDPSLADMKCVWEPSRFAAAYALARDFARTGRPLPVRLFWEMLDSWSQQNPYGQTVQWACGQESSFRAMAWIFAASVMSDGSANEANRLHRLTELIWYTGRHVDHNINYARSQKNNHAISEGAVLWTIGLLFPELVDAPRWKSKGLRILTAEVARQIYDDGSYIQHSLNYHRLMLDDLLWTFGLAEHNKVSLPSVLTDRLERSLTWALEMIDPISGGVPNYGANDGAHVLPLSCCDYSDFRPVAQAAHYLIYRRRCFEPGPWDEKAVWLFGPDVLGSPVQPVARKAFFSAPNGGYHVLRGPRSWAMTRIHSYRDRPVQADMLHVDLWMNGENILRDGGSYHYFCAQPWQHYFLSTAAHNTIEIDGVDQMVKGPRFLWFRWVRSNLLRSATSSNGRVGYLEGEHYGYARLPGRIVHRRSLCRIGDAYVIVDDLFGSGAHEVRGRWRLHPSDWREQNGLWQAEIQGLTVALRSCTAEGISRTLTVGADGSQPEGWESRYYAEKTPVPTLIAAGKTELPTRLVTFVGPAAEVGGWDAGLLAFHPEKPVRIGGDFEDDVIRATHEVSAGKILLSSADQA